MIVWIATKKVGEENRGGSHQEFLGVFAGHDLAITACDVDSVRILDFKKKKDGNYKSGIYRVRRHKVIAK